MPPETRLGTPGGMPPGPNGIGPRLLGNGWPLPIMTAGFCWYSGGNGILAMTGLGRIGFVDRVGMLTALLLGAVLATEGLIILFSLKVNEETQLMQIAKSILIDELPVKVFRGRLSLQSSFYVLVLDFGIFDTLQSELGVFFCIENDKPRSEKILASEDLE